LGKRRVVESEEEDDSESSSDEEDTAELIKELEKIKAERAAERERLEREKMYVA
jgi:protein CWC15